MTQIMLTQTNKIYKYNFYEYFLSLFLFLYKRITIWITITVNKAVIIIKLLHFKKDVTKSIPRKIIGRWFNFLTTKNWYLFSKKITFSKKIIPKIYLWKVQKIIFIEVKTQRIPQAPWRPALTTPSTRLGGAWFNIPYCTLYCIAPKLYSTAQHSVQHNT